MIMFGIDKEIIQPLNAMHRKDVVLIRGRFNPPTKVSAEMFSKSQAQVLKKVAHNRSNVLMVAEITFNCFEDFSELALEDLDRRINMLSKLGITVMITNFTYHYKFIDFLHEFTTINNLYLVLGLNNLKRVFGTKEDKKSSIDALRFVKSVINAEYKILAFPELSEKGELMGIENMRLSSSNALLMRYLIEMDRIENIENIDKDLLVIRSEKAIQAIKNSNPEWKEMVPNALVNWLSETTSNDRAVFRS
jgi:hypothetical protein